jgi:hypothetical protein
LRSEEYPRKGRFCLRKHIMRNVFQLVERETFGEPREEFSRSQPLDRAFPLFSNGFSRETVIDDCDDRRLQCDFCFVESHNLFIQYSFMLHL